MDGLVPINNEEYIVLGLTVCDGERKKRTQQAIQLFNKLIKTKGFKETSPIFGLVYIPYMEALISYQNGAFKSTIVMCRATIETAFYILSLISSFRLENNIIYPDELDDTLDLVNKKTGDKLYEVWTEILERNGLIDKEMSKIAEKIRKKGNIAAHWGTRIIREYEKFYKKYIEKHQKDPNSTSKTFYQRFSETLPLHITNKEALQYLELATDLLSKLIENTYQMAQVKYVNHDNGTN